MNPESATQTLPRLSTATPNGASPVLNGDPRSGKPFGPSPTTPLLPLLVIHALPPPSIATPKGLISPSVTLSVSWKLIGTPAFPRGYCVTLLLPQLTIQILPCWSDAVPCGWLIPPCV